MPWAVVANGRGRLALPMLAALGATLGAGCRPQPEPQSADAPPTASIRDTLVHTTPDGIGIWFTDGRAGIDSDGAECVERSVEIRTDSLRLRVPLLYATKPPTDLGRGFVRAELSLHCRTMAVYRVELATGRPLKIEDR